MYKLLLIIGLFSLSLSASAAPWCNNGSIIRIASVTWDGPSIIAMAPPVATIPPAVPFPAYYQAFEASQTYAAAFSGGGGWGNVPGKGEVRVVPFGPYNYTNTSSSYLLSEGLSFYMDKCYATVPLQTIQHIERQVISEPLEGMSTIREYESTAREYRRSLRQHFRAFIEENIEN